MLLALALALMPGTTTMPGATTFVYMFTPLVAVVIMLFVITRDGCTKAGSKSLGLHRLGVVPLFAVFLIVQTSLTNSLGEEIGWRGYLLPRLRERTQGRRGWR